MRMITKFLSARKGMVAPEAAPDPDRPSIAPAGSRRGLAIAAAAVGAIVLAAIGGVAMISADSASPPQEARAETAAASTEAPESRAGDPTVDEAPEIAATRPDLSAELEGQVEGAAAVPPEESGDEAVRGPDRAEAFAEEVRAADATARMAVPDAPGAEALLSPDMGITAAVPPRVADPARLDVPVAETEAEVAALEEIQQRANAAALSAELNEEVIVEPVDPAPILRPATVREYVNLRADPDMDADVLTVVPADAAIEAEQPCESWCAVRFGEQRGYIFADFIRGDQP